VDNNYPKVRKVRATLTIFQKQMDNSLKKVQVGHVFASERLMRNELGLFNNVLMNDRD